MKTHCPKCETIQDVPNEYANTSVKCKKCGETFKAVISVPIVSSPDPVKPTPPAPPLLPDTHWMSALGGLGIVLSLLGIFAAELGDHIRIGDCLICLMLNFLLLAIRSVVGAVNANTEANPRRKHIA